MNRKYLIIVAALVASLTAACGGGGGSSSTGTGGAGSTGSNGSAGGTDNPGGTSNGGGGGTPSSPGDTGTPANPAVVGTIASTWASMKIGGGGYVPGLVFHPTSPEVLYARTDIGGAYRWNAASASWIAITDGMGPSEGFYHGTESMAIDPNDDKRVYMSTGMYLSDNPDGRLYISSNRGDTWTWVNLPFSVGSNNQGRAVGERMMVDPNMPSILFYGSRASGLWKSTDSGKTWAQVQSLSSHKMTKAQIEAVFWSGVVGVEQVIFDTSTKGAGTPTQTIYTAVAPDYAKVAGLTHSLYKSTNGGASWSPVATPVTDYFIPHMVRAKDGMMYVAFTQGTGPGASGAARLYKFDGSNWTLLRSYDPTQWTSFGMGGLSVSGSGASTRIALGVTNSWGNWEGQPVVQLSDDAGATWREIAAMAPHNPADGGFSGWVDDVEIDPSNPERILHVTGGGVWETRNASASKPTWNFIIDGIEETASVSVITPPPGAPYLLINSALDVGTLLHTNPDQSPTLGPKGNLAFGSGFSADMAWSDPSYIAAVGHTVTNSTVAGVYSTDAGKTWNAFAANHPQALANQANETNIVVTKKDHAVWAPANSVPYYTTDSGKTWVATNLPALSRLTVNRAYRLAADRRNPNKVYAYDSGGAWWGTPPRFYISTDGGRTFSLRNDAVFAGSKLNQYHLTTMAVNPYAEGDIWLSDATSLYHSVDSGTTWKKVEPKAGLKAVNAIALGKAAAGGKYSAVLYLSGKLADVDGLFRSDDGGETWSRINDDLHQYGGIGLMAADHNVVGRVYIVGGGRGVLYNK